MDGRNLRQDLCCLGAVGRAEVKENLEVHPETRARVECARESKRGVSGYSALAIDEFGHPIGRHTDTPRELSSAHIKGLQLLRQVLAGVNCDAWHGSPIRGRVRVQVRVRMRVCESMVVDYLNIHRTIATLRPFKADAPSVVDADAVLSFAVALEHFESVSRQI